MNLSSVEKELLHLQSLVARWKEQQYTPDIERDIALERLRNIYAEFLGVKSEIQPSSTNIIPEAQVEIHTTCEPEINVEESHQTEHEEENPCDELSADPISDSQIEDIAQVIDDISQPIHEPQIEEQLQQEIAQEEPQEAEIQKEAASTSSEDESRRHRFIHDLFCNDESFYIGEMRKIEALTSLDDVLIYIGQKYAWTPDNATAEEFVTWIANRFID